MTFQESIHICFKKYTVFEGRAARPEFWWFALFGLLVDLGSWIIDSSLFPSYEHGVLSILWMVGGFLPLIAVGARRLHDMGRSGWWQLLWLTIIGGILVIVWWCFPGEPQRNRYDEVEPQTALQN